jgi:potassium-transporting ATPase KdpC subunit
MQSHLRANLVLLGSTLFLCSLVYPLVLWTVGQTVFHDKAEGSFIKEGDTVRGSHLIGQPFTKPEYFWPRPSAAGSNNGYDASASGASNWAASNALLRDRVARQLGLIARYAKQSPTKPGEPVGDDVVEWFQKQPGDYALTWATQHPKLAEQWVKDNNEAVASFLKKDGDEVKKKAADYALPFFQAYTKAAVNKGTWPTSADKTESDKTIKVIEPVKDGDAIKSYCFDAWLTANKDNKSIILEKVPADLVMSSGSGLDPHITLASANYQLGRIADEWTKKIGATEEVGAVAGGPASAVITMRLRPKVGATIEKLLADKQFAPMFGLFGEPLVNVLEVNLELEKTLEPLWK